MADVTVFDGMASDPDEDENAFEYVSMEKLREFCPNLHAFLFAKTAYGKPRSAGKLSLFVDDGRLKAALSSPTDGLVAFTTISCLRTLTAEIEDSMRKGKIEWRKDKKGRR